MNLVKSFFVFCLIMLSPTALVAQGESFWPNDPYFFYNAAERPNFPGQWHLVNQGPASIYFYSVNYLKTTTQMINSGVDAGLRQAWNLGYTGDGVTIGIVDDGVDGSNYDISPGYRTDLSKNFSDNVSLSNAPQGPQSIKDNHGTSVAGVAAARGGNGIGGTGAAPYAGIAGLRINLQNSEEIGGNIICPAGDPCISNQNFEDAYYWKSGVNTTTGAIESAPEIQVKNHSYGDEGTFNAQANSVTQALKRTAVNGVIHVFAAGNARDKKAENANKDPNTNNSSVVTVAALGSDGKFANYSSYGSSIFVTAPSNRSDYTGFGITTTDRTGADRGYNRYSSSNTSGDQDDFFPDTSYTSGFGGTSSAAPLVSGVMALGKEANPEMDVRMAKHALVKTSTIVDVNDASDSSFGGWKTNGAGNKFNPNYGFGNINAGAFVPKVRDVAYVTEQTSVVKSATFSTAIPDNDSAGVSKSFSLTAAEAGQPLEGVEVGLTYTHERVGDLTAKVKSPTGMESRILYSTSHLNPSQWDTQSATNASWTFLTNAFWGENGAGTWELNLADIAEGKTGTWLGYNTTFLMGDMVMLTPGIMTQGADIKAQSLTLLNAATTYQIPSGRTFRIRNNVLVDGGTLIVNGQITESPDYKSSMFTLAAGTVGGSGTINATRGFAHTGGTIKPGNAIGTLTIVGNYTQASNGKLLVEVASTTSNDRLAITGGADLNGVLQTSWTGGYVPALKTKFGTILTATSGVTGQFTKLITNITPTWIFKPVYDVANQVYLQVERDYNNSYLNLSVNQQAVGGALNSVANSDSGMSGDLNTVLNAIDLQTTAVQVAASLDQIAPRGDMASSFISMSGSRMQIGNIASRLQDVRSGVQGVNLRGLNLMIENDGELNLHGKPILLAFNGDTLPAGFKMEQMSDKWGFFATGNATMGNIKDNASQTDSSFRNTGLTIGGDYRFTEHLAAGFMAGYNKLRSDLDGIGSKAAINTTALGAYGMYYRNGFYLEGLVSYGLNNTDKDRRIVYPGIDRTATSDQKGRLWNLSAGTGYDYPLNNWILTPKISIDYVQLSTEDYTESGADALNLQVDGKSSTLLLGQIGGSVAYRWKMDQATLMPRIWAMYGREFGGDDEFYTTARLAIGSAAFTTYSIPPDRNFLSLGAGITASLTRGILLYLNAGCQVGQSNYDAFNLNAGIRVPF